MNRRIKSEEPSKSTNSCKMAITQRARKIIKLARTKTPVKKRTLRKTRHLLRKGSSSDEEFEFKASGSINKFPFNTRCTTSSRRLQSTIVPTKIIKTRQSTMPENIYQISDSSDDDELQIVKDNETVSATINLCETDDSINQSKVDVLDEILKEVKNNKSNSHPSTSTAQTGNKTEIPEFIDNLLESNEDLLDENYLKSLKELNDQNEKLLQSSWNLINNAQEKTFEDSVIFVSTEDLSQKPVENIPEACALPAPGPIEIKSCPICLEKLGAEPVSSTICGHIFCSTCIKNCVKTQKKCPTCRKHLTSKMIHPLFLF